MKFCAIALLTAGVCFGQELLTLAEAEQIALRTHPALQSSRFSAEAAQQVITEARASQLPTIFGSVTGAGALNGSRLAAGALNNPIIYDRLASGVTVGQLVTDFGRSKDLIETSKVRSPARNQNPETTREQIILGVQRTYF